MAERDINKMQSTEYKPFSKAEGFKSYTNESGEVCFIAHHNIALETKYILEIKPKGGFVPKSGLIVAQCIEGVVQGKKVLDMCTGETGILAIHSSVSGADQVTGVDVDEDTVNWARYNGELNGLTNVEWKVSNLFEELGERKFDVIISNPPQMPMEKGPAHDWGGINGRNFIESIIENSPRFLSENGELYMLIFDFLGVDKTYGNVVPLQDVFEQNGFNMDIIARERRKVRKGGQTEKSLAYILSEYPMYNFQSDGDSLSHQVFIVKAVLEG